MSADEGEADSAGSDAEPETRPRCARCCCVYYRLKGCIDRFVESEEQIHSEYRPNRYPTDLLCLAMFVFFWMGMVVVAALALDRGNPRYLYYPTDRENNVCGEFNPYDSKTNKPERDLRNKTYLWYPFSISLTDPEKSRLFDALDMGICVTTCPNVSALTLTKEIISGDWAQLFNLVDTGVVCEYDLQELSSWDRAELVRNGSGCYVNWLPTEAFHMRCIPDINLADALSSVEKSTMNAVMYTGNVLKTSVYELQASYPVLLLLVGAMVIVCFVFLTLVQLFIKFFVYTVLFLVFFVLGTAAAYCGWVGYRKNLQAAIDGDTDGTGWSNFWIVLSIVLGVGELIYLLLMVFLLNRIGIAMEIISIAAKPIQRIPWMAVVPVLTFLVTAGVTVYWAIIAAYIQSATIGVTLTGETLQELADYVSYDLNMTSNTTVFQSDSVITGMQYYHLFGYLWTMAFFSAFGYIVVAGVVSNWYFSNPGAKDKHAGCFPVVRSCGRVIIFHMGSVLFGSLLIAIVQFLRIMARELEKRLTAAQANNKLTLCLFRILHIVLCILQRIIKFINKNAYILIMIHGKCFTSSSVRAIVLIITNILQIGVVNFIGDFMLFLGQIGLTLLGTVICYFLLDLANGFYWLNWLIYLAPTSIVAGQELHQLEYYIVPMLAGAAISFIVTGLFVNLYRTSIDTVLMCFCEDRRINNGSEKKPYYMPPELSAKLRCCRNSTMVIEHENGKKEKHKPTLVERRRSRR